MSVVEDESEDSPERRGLRFEHNNMSQSLKLQQVLTCEMQLGLSLSLLFFSFWTFSCLSFFSSLLTSLAKTDQVPSTYF